VSEILKSVGLIVEYNPFHNGHINHAFLARKKTQARLVIAVMSGNFLQRGEPAIIDKWHRAQAALENGVDLVIELPVRFALQSADYFAKGSINILQKLGVNSLVFGTDVKSEVDYAKFGKDILAKQKEIEEYIAKSKQRSQNYPSLLAEAYRHFFPKFPLGFALPNHILGISYAKENAKYKTPMTIVPIERAVNFNDELNAANGKIASATAIRKSILQGTKQQIQNFVPTSTWNSLAEFVSWENYFSLLKYKITSSSSAELSEIYQMQEGFEHRLLDKIKTANYFSQLMEKIKTKRYTYTRIQRLLAYVLLNFQKKDFADSSENYPLRILGFTEMGRKFLHSKQKKNLNLISKVDSSTEGLDLTKKADSIYQLGNQTIPEQNYGRIPIYI